MHEAMEKSKKICTLKDQLLALVEAEMAKGAQCVDTAEAGAVIDMIKDLSKVEKDCWEACYYKKIVEAMEEEAEMGGERAGYDNWRYSSGRFAPKGRGHRSGYTPEMYEGMDFGRMMDQMRMGYGQGGSRGNSGSSSSGGSMGGRGGSRSGYGDSYDQWQDSRRHYSESRDESSKMEMDQHAQEHVKKMMESVQEMWKEADPELRRHMKMDLKAFTESLQ